MTSQAEITTVAAAATELLTRRHALEGLIGFTTYTFPGFEVARHHSIIASKLQAVERGEIDRLMIFCPPRHSKSELASCRFPAWVVHGVGRNADQQQAERVRVVRIATKIGTVGRCLQEGADQVGTGDSGTNVDGKSLLSEECAVGR